MTPGPQRDADAGVPARGAPGSWSLPLRLESGRIAPHRADHLADTVRLVLGVAPGERPLRPDFGCRFHHLASIRDGHDRAVAAALAEEALERWAPWLGVRRVDVVGVEAGRLRIVVSTPAERAEVRVAWRRTARGRRAPEEDR